MKRTGKKLGYNNPKVKKGLEAYWEKCSKNREIKEKAIKLEKVKTKKAKPPAISPANVFAEQMKGTLTLLKEQGLTLEQTAKKLQSMKIKTRLGKTNWRITQVVRLQKRLGL